MGFRLDDSKNQRDIDRFTQTVRTGTINTESVIQSWGLDADLTLLPLRNVELFGQTNYRNHPSEDNRRTQRWLVDVGIRYQPSRVIELELKLQNLTDADTYTDIRYRDTDMFVTDRILLSRKVRW